MSSAIASRHSHNSVTRVLWELADYGNDWLWSIIRYMYYCTWSM